MNKHEALTCSDQDCKDCLRAVYGAGPRTAVRAYEALERVRQRMLLVRGLRPVNLLQPRGA